MIKYFINKFFKKKSNDFEDQSFHYAEQKKRILNLLKYKPDSWFFIEQQYSNFSEYTLSLKETDVVISKIFSGIFPDRFKISSPFYVSLSRSEEEIVNKTILYLKEKSLNESLYPYKEENK